MVNLGNDWDAILADEFEKEYYKELRRFLVNEYRTRTIYPNMNDIFNALKFTSFEDTKAVILGQDPYHGEHQAHGLCFSVLRGIEPPPSLKNIYKELASDVGFVPPMHGELTHWAEQGVLMLNAVLTVRAHQANSHQRIGWEEFTDAAIRVLAEEDRPMVFILWGRPAGRKREMIHNRKHLVIMSPHPSPLSASRGFFGSRPFSRANEHLAAYGVEPVDWSL